jgi:hypothetical protein
VNSRVTSLGEACSWLDRVDEADAHEGHDAGERDRENGFGLLERAHC